MRAVLLLGRRDNPTDALEDYSARLAHALEVRGEEARLARVSWAEDGWWRGLSRLRGQASEWQPGWVLFQYTALQWSRRGWPVMAPAVIWVLRRLGLRVASVFHDSNPYPPRPDADLLRRIWDRLRRLVQRLVMRVVARMSAVVIVAVPADRTSWLPAGARFVLLPVGANISDSPTAAAPQPAESPAVAVFSFTGPPVLAAEVDTISDVVRVAGEQVPGLRLIVCGRNSELAAEPLRQALDGSRVMLQVIGVPRAEAIKRALVGASVLLFVRGQVSSRRSSAVAALACGLPIVGYAGSETGFPLTEAGVSLVPGGDRKALAAALVRVLTDPDWREALRLRSSEAFSRHFSWSAIADRLRAELGRV